MRILLATGIYLPQIGGPAQYARHLTEEFVEYGYIVKVLNYKLESRLPSGLRHLLFFVRVLFSLRGVDLILALDTFSVGWPAALAAFLFRKKMIIRIGGDFLWESHLERTGNLIPLARFYDSESRLSFKERLIFKLVSWTLGRASGLAFTTPWQREIWQEPYRLSRIKNITVIDNHIGQKLDLAMPLEAKTYLFAARPLKLKNQKKLEQAFILAQQKYPEIKLKVLPPVSHDELLRQIASSYAVLIPSVSEISPNLAWDAIRCNKPFILTRECGYAERLKNEAVLVNPLDINDLKEKIGNLAEENIYHQKKKLIMAREENRPWSKVAQDFLNFFSEI